MRGAILGSIEGREVRVCSCGTRVEHLVIRYAVRRVVGGIAHGTVYEPRDHRAPCGRQCGRGLPPGVVPAVERHHLEGCQLCALGKRSEARACSDCGLWRGVAHSCPPSYVCRECGDETQARVQAVTRARMERERLCYLCFFWTRKVELRDAPTVVRSRGVHYILGEEDPRVPASARGFGGKLATITYLDGTCVTSSNVWHQGTIPEHFRDRLPDNAVLTWADEHKGTAGHG